MTSEKKVAERTYTWEELLSFDRMKRAILSRVLEKAEQEEQGNFPLASERLCEMIEVEWQRAKEAVRSSPAARQAAREHLHRVTADLVGKLIQDDHAELEAMGVVEKTI